MPTYPYLCTECDHSFETYQSMSDKALKTCPECGKKKLERVITGGSGVVFKGGGFYETDYKRGEGSDYKKKKDSESKGKSSDKKSTSKTESKSKTKKSSTSKA